MGFWVVLIVVYSVWSIYSGWKLTTNKIPILNREGVGYFIGKIILTIVLGYVFGAFNLIITVLALLGLVSRD